MCLVSPAGRFIQVNPHFCRMLGLAETELVGRGMEEVTHPDHREATRVTLQRLLDGGRVEAEMGTRYVKRDGGEVWAQLTATAVRGGEGDLRYVVAEIQDVTRRKIAEEALSRSEKTYRNLFENHPGPRWVFDAQTLRFLAVNDAAVRVYGYSRAEFRSMTVFDVRPPEEVPKLQELLRSRGPGATEPEEWLHRKKDGTDFWVSVTAHRIRFEGREAVLVGLEDLTEKRRAEAALRRTESHLQQAAKMEAIGRLAGGIAHDFNNLLTVIQGFAQLLSKKGPGSPELDEIRQAAARGAALTHQLLAFSRRQVLSPKVIDLNARVQGMDLMLRRVIGENIELALRLEPGLAPVEADPGQLDQVILNLVLNARDAMPAGGRLTVETHGTTGPEPPGGPWVTLVVTDSGAGMDVGTMTHIFEPFFTTKDGRGTGLGLATVYGIVQQSGGQVRVTSEPGRGSSFRVYLPASSALPLKPDHAAASGPWRGAETVLVVEDDPAVRALVSAILRQSGYIVLAAGDAEQALALAESDPRPIHLAVTDVVLPRLPGPELVRRLRARRPRLLALFISGHVDDALSRPGAVSADESFLAKPFTDESLARRVRELLDSRAPILP
jgi:PAS domain S-box-containing protein